MIKEQLTSENVSMISRLSYHIQQITESIDRIKMPVEVSSDDIYISRPSCYYYDELITKHGVGDILETIRLLIYVRLQRKKEEMQKELLDLVNCNS